MSTLPNAEGFFADKTAMNLITLGAIYKIYGNGRYGEGEVDEVFEERVFAEAGRRLGIERATENAHVDYAEFKATKRIIIPPYVQSQLNEHLSG